VCVSISLLSGFHILAHISDYVVGRLSNRFNIKAIFNKNISRKKTTSKPTRKSQENQRTGYGAV